MILCTSRIDCTSRSIGSEMSLFDLQRRGSGIGADQRRTFDDERRILLFAQRDEAEGAASKQDEKENQTTFLFFSEYSGRLMTVSL